MNVNVWGVADQIAALVASKQSVDARQLADESVALDSLVSSSPSS
jgi:hypothetical protein